MLNKCWTSNLRNKKLMNDKKTRSVKAIKENEYRAMKRFYKATFKLFENDDLFITIDFLKIIMFFFY